MNSNNFLELLQDGFLATVGATASLLETWQDQHQREAMLSQLNAELEQKVREWREKGQLTEREARRIIDELLNRQSSSTPATEATANGEDVSGEAEVDPELRSLIEQIVALRTELANLRRSDVSK